MDHLNVPHKIATEIATYQGEWTAEEIEAGLAGEPRVDVVSSWYEPGPDGPQEVTDPVRIQELEDSIR